MLWPLLYIFFYPSPPLFFVLKGIYIWIKKDHNALPPSVSHVKSKDTKEPLLALRLGIHYMRNNAPVFSDGSRGSIVLISSMSGYFGGTGVVSYVASKHAITGLLRSSQDIARKTDIRVNAVAPFFTPTQITVGYSQKWKESNLPANTTSDVAQAILYTTLNSALRGCCMMVRKEFPNLFHL